MIQFLCPGTAFRYPREALGAAVECLRTVTDMGVGGLGSRPVMLLLRDGVLRKQSPVERC